MILDGLICSHYSFDHWQVATTKTTGMSAFRQALKPLHTLPISLTTLVCLSMHTHNHHTPAHRRGEVFTFSLGTPNTVNADATFEKTQKQTKLFYTLLPDRPRPLFIHLQMHFFQERFSNLRKNKQSQKWMHESIVGVSKARLLSKVRKPHFAR